MKHNKNWLYVLQKYITKPQSHPLLLHNHNHIPYYSNILKDFLFSIWQNSNKKNYASLAYILSTLFYTTSKTHTNTTLFKHSNKILRIQPKIKKQKLPLGGETKSSSSSSRFNTIAGVFLNFVLKALDLVLLILLQIFFFEISQCNFSKQLLENR